MLGDKSNNLEGGGFLVVVVLVVITVTATWQ
jgi:hypothetical protein